MLTVEGVKAKSSSRCVEQKSGTRFGAQAGREEFNSGIINYMQVGRLKSKLRSTPNSNEPPLLMQRLACMKQPGTCKQLKKKKKANKRLKHITQ